MSRRHQVFLSVALLTLCVCLLPAGLRADEGEKKIALFTQWIDDLRSKAEQEGALQINESYLKYDIGETEEATEGEEERAD